MIVVLLAISIFYTIGWDRLSRSLPKLLEIWRPAAFLAGIAAIWLALDSPLAGLDRDLLTADMMQHLVLMAVAAPLILLSAPSIVMLHALPPRLVRDTLAPLLRTSTVHRLELICGHPAFGWLAGSVTVVAWHVPGIFNLARESHHWPEVEQACFLLAGFLFWWPVVRPWPTAANPVRWSVPLYLFLATLPCDALSAFLVFSDHVVYHAYVARSGAFNLSPLQDQIFAGAFMWATVTLAYMVPALVMMVRILSGRLPQPSEVQSRFLKR